MNWVVLDFETASGANLKKVGAWRYAEDPSTEIICLCGKNEDGHEWTWTPNSPTAIFNETIELAFNPTAMFVMFAGFEKAIWRTIMVPDFGFPDIPNSRWHDIQATAAMKVLPLDLKRCAQVLQLKHQKDMAGNKGMLALSKTNKKGYYVHDPKVIQDTIDYCVQDVRTETELHQHLGFLPSGERNVWLINQRVNDRGIRIDIPYIEACKQVVERATVPVLKEFQALTSVNPTQRDKFLDWMKTQGCDPGNLTKETVTELLGGDDDELGDVSEDAGEQPAIEARPVSLPPSVHRALVLRNLVNSTSVKKLYKMAECVCDDGRARGTSLYHSAGPGRSGGRLFNPYNFPRPTLKHGDKPVDPDTMVAALMTGDPEYVDIVIGPPIAAVAQGLRHALIPDRDRVFVSGDYAGIQLRVLLALAGQHDKCDLLASGRNAYCDMAEQIYKRPIDKHNDVPEYTIGKNSVLGLGFQMGPGKFSAKYAKNLPEEFIEEVVRIYRKEWAPKVPKVWYGLEAAASKTVWDRTPHEAYGCEYRIEDEWLTVRLPSGRKLWYFAPEPVKNTCPWIDDNTGKPAIKPGFTFQAMKTGQWKTVAAFGGLLTENVVMGIECDIARTAQIKLEQNNIPIVLEVYDEIVVEPLIKDADEKLVTQIMIDVDPWVKELQVPIAVETWSGRRYRK